MMGRRRFLGGLLGWFTAIAVGVPSVQAESLEADAKKFLDGLADKAIHALTKTEVPRAERVKRFRRLFNDHFAVRVIGKWILGRYWKRATADQQREYLVLFEDLMVVSYVDRFTEYAGEALNITGTEAIAKETVIVHSEIIRPTGGPPIRVDWRVGRDADIYKIVDVIVEGTSMSTTLRSDFGSIIRRNGGHVAGLIEELRKKTKGLKKSL